MDNDTISSHNDFSSIVSKIAELHVFIWPKILVTQNFTWDSHSIYIWTTKPFRHTNIFHWLCLRNSWIPCLYKTKPLSHTKLYFRPSHSINIWTMMPFRHTNIFHWHSHLHTKFCQHSTFILSLYIWSCVGFWFKEIFWFQVQARHAGSWVQDGEGSADVNKMKKSPSKNDWVVRDVFFKVVTISLNILVLGLIYIYFLYTFIIFLLLWISGNT